MANATRAAATVLFIGLLAMIIHSLAGTSDDQTNAFPFAFIFAAIILALVAGVKKWKTLPWLPWLGIVAAAGGYLANSSIWMNSGFFAFAVLTIWHDHQHERKLRAASSY